MVYRDKILKNKLNVEPKTVRPFQDYKYIQAVMSLTFFKTISAFFNWEKCIIFLKWKIWNTHTKTLICDSFYTNYQEKDNSLIFIIVILIKKTTPLPFTTSLSL